MKKRIDSGIYVVIDPAMQETILINKIKKISTQNIAAIQIWDNFKNSKNITQLIEKISAICSPKNIPVLINNRWELLINNHLDGVHFDEIPKDFEKIKSKINRDFIIGLTCENNLKSVEWANKKSIDYISFCSMFPSSSAGSCEIVNFKTVEKARKIFDKPLFLSGGISPEKIKDLKELSYDGIAVISGIMNAENPTKAIIEYQQNLNN